jgi:argininosuccinate lyase
MKLWTKNQNLNKTIERFTVGDDYILDQKLVKYDCLASIAHAKMLGKIGILKPAETSKIVRELKRIIALDEKGRFKINPEDEDCHTAIENHLTKKLGDIGKKIHTARSRNDQVLTVFRLYEKEELKNCRKLAKAFIGGMKAFVKKNGAIKFPGYTHTRKAMPSSVKLWGGAFIDSMQDNIRAIDFTLELIDQSPLGTGAGYGVPLKIDRQYTARLLGFKTVQKNPIYAQLSRGKFESAILQVLSQITGDMNRMASDLILFSLPEIGYFELPKGFCTGSSIMPHKKNPDVLELVRAKHHAIISREFEVKNLTTNLISGYHRDLQLTKKPTMEAFDITEQCLVVMALVFTGLMVNKKKCEQALTKEVYAAEEAIKLAKKGVPFRDAYRKVGEEYKQ